MTTKLSTLEQVAQLRKGDIIKKYPASSNRAPEDLFDADRKEDINTYEVRSINPDNEIIGLVMAGDSLNLLPSPWEVGRLFIKSYNLVAEKVWWV